MSALSILTDFIKDPNDDGSYRLEIGGEDLKRLWDAAESDDKAMRSIHASTDLEAARQRAYKALKQ